MSNLIDRYNELLRTTEDGTLRLLNGVLEAAFKRLVIRVRAQIKAGAIDPAQRNLALLQEFRQLVPAYRPDRVDAYDRIFRNLALSAQDHGLAIADDLTEAAFPGHDRIDVSIPLEATVEAAKQARGYLAKHGHTFAETAATTVAQGIAEGRPTDAMVQDMRSRLGIVKSRADVIVRTEALRAYNSASDTYYAAQGIAQVMYYATADDRSCPYCAPRAGNIYKRGDIKVPLHPRCRCYLAPWDADANALNPDYEKMRKTHKQEVAKAVRLPETVPLTKPARFEQITPTPLQR
jgi:SPP1 gp7 family putative phage head morphogenesis protein